MPEKTESAYHRQLGLSCLSRRRKCYLRPTVAGDIVVERTTVPEPLERAGERLLLVCIVCVGRDDGEGGQEGDEVG